MRGFIRGWDAQGNVWDILGRRECLSLGDGAGEIEERQAEGRGRGTETCKCLEDTVADGWSRLERSGREEGRGPGAEGKKRRGGEDGPHGGEVARERICDKRGKGTTERRPGG